MKSFAKYISKRLLFFAAFVIFLLLINLLAFGLVFQDSMSEDYGENSPKRMLEEVSEALTQDGLPDNVLEKLENNHIWAMLLDDNGNSIWAAFTPKEIPAAYSLQDVALFSKGYLQDYPVFTWNTENGLLVLGYPKDSYAKITDNYYSVRSVQRMPAYFFGTLLLDLLLLFLAYYFSKQKILKNTGPIVAAVETLSDGTPAHLSVNGELSAITESINKTSEILSRQNDARANWISGVSHDIRTPLSMIMGYAEQLQSDTHLTDTERKMTAIIIKHSERIRNLVSDLNLASKLEYNMQPISVKQENAVAIVRQAAVDFINTDIYDKYPIEWLTDEELSACLIHADRDLLKRAISNLIQNCINHNENGCTIYVSVSIEQNNCVIRVEDNGIGASDEQIEKLNTAPHYMVCDTNTTEQRHGLGLLIVKQIVDSHNGTTYIEHSTFGGFAVKLKLPM